MANCDGILLQGGKIVLVLCMAKRYDGDMYISRNECHQRFEWCQLQGLH